jgi:Phosphotransferase enzyme family
VPVTPRPPYDRTAERPGWSELPEAVRSRVAELAGAPVAAAGLAGGGFTRGYAGLLSLGDGREVFVKAASLEERPVAATSYRTEGLVLAALPNAVPAPRLRWADEVEGWVLLGIDPVHGRMPGLPWTPADVAAAVRACEESAAALTPAPPGLELPRLVDELHGGSGWLTWFGQVATGDSGSSLLSGWARSALSALQELVSSSPRLVDGDSACHGDLRADNMLVDAAGKAWICDWNWLSLGAAWTDLVGLLVTVHADGLDADAMLAGSPLGADAPAEAVDAWLAVIAAFMLSQAGDEPPEFASPWIGPHRAYFGTAALSWLEQRRSP